MVKLNLEKIQNMKGRQKITVLTAYSAATANILAEADIDLILVGDSLGMVFQGRENTLGVTVDDMVYHAKAVRRGAPENFMIVDLPFMSYQVNAEQTLINAGKIMKESNANAVKLEGASQVILESIEKITAAGIPVMGHLGFTPQSVNRLSGYKVQGRELAQAKQIEAEALALEKAGVFAMVIEMVPAALAKKITTSVNIPVISCGAGPDCDGQVLVIDDIFGLYPRTPKFAKKYKDIRQEMLAAVKAYSQEVRQGTFPDQAHSF